MMTYSEYVDAMTAAILKAATHAHRTGVKAMSIRNLKQLTSFPAGAANPNVAERAFMDALALIKVVLPINVFDEDNL